MNQKHKILYVITSLGIGGAEKLLLSYLKLLDHQKYDFHVIALREKPDDLLSEISKYAEVYKFTIKNKFNPKVIFYISEKIKQIKPDIIHTHLIQARIYTTFARMISRFGILITHKHNNVNLTKHYFFILLESFCLIFNKKIISISRSVKRSLNRYEFVPSSKIIVIPNAIDYNRYNEIAKSRKISKENQLVIGTICRLERQKGISYLLLAMKSILIKFPMARLEIIGDGSLLDELKDLSRKLGISNSVIFFGKFADVIPFYSRMNIFVLPSLYEGFGIVLLEAMAAGVPIVATNVDGIKEVVINGESGVLVPPKNPGAISNAVIKLLEDTQFADHLVIEGLKRAKLFDIQEHIVKIDSLYTSLVGEESHQ